MGYRYPPVYVYVIVHVNVRVKRGVIGGGMRFTSIYDSLWTDSGFKLLSPHGKLLFLCLMSSPIFGFAGVCYATLGLLSEYSQLPARDCEKALAELLNSGAIIKFGDYLVIKNYLLFNKCSGDKIETKLINDFNALPKEVFAGIMSIPIIKEVYLRSCAARDREPRDTNGLIAVSDYSPVQIELKPKPVFKESLAPESEQITRLRGYAKAIFDEIGNCKNKPELSTDEYQKLIDKWGFDKLVVMQRIYYEWKASLTKKHTHTDFGTLKKGGWVLEKIKAQDDKIDFKNPSGRFLDDDQLPT